ncbi:MAG: response regulator [Bacteroidales bacterium]|jgi:CheY-like chemotaxis protein
MKVVNNNSENVSSGEEKKILVVEDEMSNYELLKAMMRKLNVKILWAKNGINAVKLCDEQTFDLILMDIKMPGMDGYEATSIIRRKNAKTPIIAQTAYARSEDEKNILQKGFNGYISKPIDRAKLLGIIESFI